MIDNPALRDAAGNTAVRNPSQTFLLSPGRRISREEEVFTPPGGGGGGVRPLSLRVYHVRYELYQKLFQTVFRRTGYEDGGQNIGSPVDMLVDTVSRMQKDLAMLREENRSTKNTSHLTGDTGSSVGGAHDDESAVVRWNY